MAGSSASSPRKRRRSPLRSITDLVIRRPKTVLAIWFLLLGFLAVQGNDLESKVSTSPLLIDGSETQRETEVSSREFGSDSALILMLRGPQADLDRQGPVLVRRLDALPETLVNSPWDGGGVMPGLRPSPRVAGIVVSAGKAPGSTSGAAVARIEAVAHRTASGPVRVSIAGGLPLAYALTSSSAEAATTGEMLAVPILLLVLLFVCRSFIAAAMPVVIGAIVVAATKGVVDLSSPLVRIDTFALGAAGMLGLALGVDYSLLTISRFREELERHDDIEAAVRETMLAVGRTVIPAGGGLVLAMLIAAQLLPAAVISSVSLAVITASILGVVSALTATPAVLMLLGRHLDRFSLPRRESGRGMLPRWTQRLSRRPAMVVAVGFTLFLCAAWGFTLQTKVGTVEELPPNNGSRIQHEEIQDQLGPGWIAPEEVVLSSGDGPVTSSRTLAALTRFQHRVEADPGVAAMTGFAALKRGSEQFAKLGPGLKRQQSGMVRLHAGLAKAEKGSGRTEQGFESASTGARQLVSALGQTVQGSGSITRALRTSAAGSERLGSGLAEADDGSGKLAAGASKSSDGASKLAAKVRSAQEKASESSSSTGLLTNALSGGEEALEGLEESVQGGDEQLAAAQQALQRMSSGRADPQYTAALAAVNAARADIRGDAEEEEPALVQAGIEEAQDQFGTGLYLAAKIAKSSDESQKGMSKLADSTGKLADGLRKLARSSDKLSEGLGELSGGGAKLSPGLRKLSLAAARLTGGLGEIGDGAGELAGGLDSGATGSGVLTDALGKLTDGSGKMLGPNGESRFASLNRNSPGLFKSGYFFLAGLDGTKPARREQTAFLINLDGGGTTARMTILPRDEPSDSQSHAVQDRLRGYAGELEREARSEVLIGGVTPAVFDVDTDLRSQTPLARLVLSLVTILVLLLVTRSLLLPVISALLNLITVSATFGLLSLFFNGSLLGGPGYVDTIIVPASIILVFGLAIDYEVFIFARIREEYLRTGSTELAIENGLSRSANVVTGAAIIMISVFLAFAVVPLSTLRAFGVALAVAVFIDAFLIRFVIVPAVMRALGDRCWWLPRWLDRLLPGGNAPNLAAEEA
jgi:RND superfamily putative drug exporter